MRDDLKGRLDDPCEDALYLEGLMTEAKKALSKTCADEGVPHLSGKLMSLFDDLHAAIYMRIR